MNRIWYILFTYCLISCTDDKKNHTPNTPTNNENSIIDRIESHMGFYEIKPSIQINNINGNQKEVKLLNHTIQWIDTEKETKIKIDDKLISLKSKLTLNIVHDSGNDEVDFANNWDEIKLFQHYDRNIIGIRMKFQPCTGIGCGVNYFLLYDVSTKTENYFGTFHTNNELMLYNFYNDYKIDYVTKTFSGDLHGSTPIDFIYTLYSLEDSGQFKEQKNSNGHVYQLKHTTYPNDTTKRDVLVHNWIQKIKK